MGRSGAGWGDDWERDGGRSARGGHGDPRGLSASQISSALREAQQLQQDGRVDEAIGLCEDLLDQGVDRSDARYFLGWLYQETERWDDAADQFQMLLSDPDYVLSCFYALGQCARAVGNVQEAAQFFDEAVDRVNLDELTREESDQLLQLCQEAAEAHREMGDPQGAETVYSALLGFLRSRGWREQAEEIERLMAESGGPVPPQPRRRTGIPSQRIGSNMPQRAAAPGRAFPPRQGAAGMQPPAAMPQASFSSAMPGVSAQVGAVGQMPPAGMPDAYSASALAQAMTTGDPLDDLIASFSREPGSMRRAGLPNLPEPQRTQVGNAVREVGNYVAHGLLTAAIEECLRIIELAPQYLDVHLMMGEIYVRQGKIEQAIAKYAILVDTFLVNGRVDEAIATYRRILQLEPNNLTYRVKLIDLLTRQGRAEEVLEERMAAADSYLRLGYADRAIQEYEQALVSHPGNTDLRLNYAQALMRAGKGPQAIGEYQRVLQVEPNNVKALCRYQAALAMGAGGAGAPATSRATALETLGRLLKTMRLEGMRGADDVVREYQQALEYGPASADLRYALGQVYLAAGRPQEAQDAFQQMANAPGMEVLARFAEGQALLSMGDANGAAQAVRALEEASAAARRSAPEPTVWAARPRVEGEDRLAPDLEISMLLAKAYQLAGQVGKMQATLDEVKGARGYGDEVYRALAEISAKQGDPQGQLREYAQLVRHYRANKMVENAVTVLREMIRIAPEDPTIHSELAEIFTARGLLDEGLAEMGQVAEIHVRHGQLAEGAGVYQRMADISWEMGNRDNAIALLYQAIGYAPEDMLLRRTLVQYCLLIPRLQEAAQQQQQIAEYYYKSRQTKDAVEALQQLIALDKQNVSAYEMLGQTYAAVGEYPQAERVYRNLARIDPTSELARARLQELQSMRARG